MRIRERILGILGHVLLFLLSLLAYVYRLRFPLLTAIGVVGFWAAAFFTDARPLLLNAFDISWPRGIFYLSFTAFAAAWVVMVTWRLVLLYGAERFGSAERFGKRPYQVSANVKWWHVGLSSLIALPIVCGAVYHSTRNNLYEIAEAVLGGLAALIFLGLAAVVQKLFTRREFAQKRPLDTAQGARGLARKSPDMFFPSPQREPVARLIHRVKQRDPASRLRDWLARRRIIGLFSRVPENVGRGYFEYNTEGRVVSILPGHSLAITLFVSTTIFYVLVGLVKFLTLEQASFPTLAYLLLLLMSLCWGLSGLAFFLDRFRIPVIIPLLLVLFVTSQPPWSDHFYPVTDTQTPPPVEGNPTSGDTVIVVAANGGGIQAAAWTARVLTGLEKELGDDFGRSIRLVSSVSGGSVGAMYFVNEYTEDGPPSGSELDRIVERAEGSSLDEIAWGLLYPDFARLLTSYGPKKWDRGRALEEAWLRYDLSWENRDNVKAGLSEWREDVAAGWRPGSIFNATVTDTGERLPLSTIDLPPDKEGTKSQDRLFETLNSKDIQVVTATRLSASFPYVSPAARANNGSLEAAHIVDGGYYDNYGVSSFVEWLDSELDKGNVNNVLVLEIRGTRTGGDYQLESNRGWFYQAFAPLSTLVHVRDTGQLSHNEIELDLLSSKWEGKITCAVFEFDGADPPLSWHLNEQEKKNIEQDWESELDGSKARRKGLSESSLDTVKNFLGQAQETNEGCGTTS